MNAGDQGELQVMLQDLQMLVMKHVTAMDAPVAEQWMEDALDEAYSEAPRAAKLRIFLGEIRKKAPRSAEIGKNIDAIEVLLSTASGRPPSR